MSTIIIKRSFTSVHLKTDLLTSVIKIHFYKHVLLFDGQGH